MNNDQVEAREMIAAADQAKRAGMRAAVRPPWYPPALGLSLALALASFAVPWLNIVGVVLGAVVLPVVIETAARRVTGAAPLGDYLSRDFRGVVLSAVLVVVVLTAAALVHLKVTDEVWGVLAGAVVVGLVTTWGAARVSRRRSRGTQTRRGGQS